MLVLSVTILSVESNFTNDLEIIETGALGKIGMSPRFICKCASKHMIVLTTTADPPRLEEPESI